MNVEEAEKSVYETHAGEFALFYSLLMDGNERASLTSIKGERDVYVKHFVDSVACAELFPSGADVVEIGSGGGFPSVPLRIVRPDLSFTLVESERKKCSFLSEALSRLGLSGTEVVCSRAEEAGRDPRFRERFDACCARAVAPLNVLCELCLPFVRVGGLFVAYKGPSVSDEVSDASYAVSLLGGRLSETVPYDLPDGFGGRTAVVFRKIAPTPERYPRAAGRPGKRPLRP